MIACVLDTEYTANMLTGSPEWFSPFNDLIPVIGWFGANIPSDNSTPFGLIFALIILAIVGALLWQKIVVQKNTPVAVLVGAVLIVITLIALHGCK